MIKKRRRGIEWLVDDDDATVDVWVKIALWECERTHCGSNSKRPEEKNRAYTCI